jgi:hypothetical protein
VEARSEQDQRPKYRRHDGRDDLGDRGEVGVVIVLGSNQHADDDVCKGGQAAHSIIFAARGGAPAQSARSPAKKRAWEYLDHGPWVRREVRENERLDCFWVERPAQQKALDFADVLAS